MNRALIMLNYFVCDCCVLFGSSIICLLWFILSYRLYGVQCYLCEEVNDHRLLKRQVVLLDHKCSIIFLYMCRYICVDCMCWDIYAMLCPMCAFSVP
jgi:hypothetical protein